MNYLAHIFLSFEVPEIMLGNFIADQVSHKNLKLISPEIRMGIDLHRQIDHFTDRHSSFRAATKRLRPDHKKYAPVVLDILNDHLLAMNWNLYSNQTFDQFEVEVYKKFEPLVKHLPPKSKRHVDSLLTYQYLKAYTSQEGMKDVLRRMDIRARFTSNFENAIDDLYADYSFYNDHFRRLFQDLIDMIKDRIDNPENLIMTDRPMDRQ